MNDMQLCQRLGWQIHSAVKGEVRQVVLRDGKTIWSLPAHVKADLKAALEPSGKPAAYAGKLASMPEYVDEPQKLTEQERAKIAELASG